MLTDFNLGDLNIGEIINRDTDTSYGYNFDSIGSVTDQKSDNDFFRTTDEMTRFIQDTILPGVIESKGFSGEDPGLTTPIKLVNKVSKLKKSLRHRTGKLIKNIGFNVVNELIAGILFSLGSSGAKRIYNYLYPANIKQSKYSHKHILEDGTEIKILDEILKNGSETEIVQKINDILKIKYHLNVPLGNVIFDAHYGKYDRDYPKN